MTGISTKTVRTNDENRALRAKFIESSLPILEKYNIPAESFVPKAIFEDNGEKYIKLYPGEAAKGKDLYIEFVTLNYEPILVDGNNREILVWKYNPHYKEEYRSHEVMTTEVYLIPILELTVVGNEKSNLKTTNIGTVTPVKGRSLMTDAPYSQMTIRDYFAIFHKKPVSSKPWLNELIKNTFNE
jgi:hypothetical protein